MPLLSVSLEDRYRFEAPQIYLNGTQSLVRLTQMERRRRLGQGRNAAVYISGYRGSPLGGFDLELIAARKHLGEHILFHPGVNEDIAATAVWGTQQLGTFAHGSYDGVSALWYGKGPGVDRTGDVFKHGNLAGTSREGGVLVVAGDDHTAKSSTTAHQSEFGLVDAMIPVLAPSSIAEQIEYGLIGWELSRYSGLWVGLKVVTEIMDSSASLAADIEPCLTMPHDFVLPEGGLSLRWPDTPLLQEERLHRFKLPAAMAFARVNCLDRVVIPCRSARIGIVTVGKSHGDTIRALEILGIDARRANSLGLRLYKVAMPWPLGAGGIQSFSDGLSEIIVVEEKRPLVEDQIRQILYGRPNGPRIVGKRDEDGNWLLPSNGDLGPDLIASALGPRIARVGCAVDIGERANAIAARRIAAKASETLVDRPPHFCSGCPHNRSTQVPEGSKAFAGIGCHYLVQSMDRKTEGFTHMGGEGANWIGLSPFASTDAHVFQNLGDGTYFHSGSLAIRAAVAAGVNITYKILFNSAVAMTGGQAMDGDLSPEIVARQLIGEGVGRVVIVRGDIAPAGSHSDVNGVTTRHRDELDAVQRELREVRGVSAIIFDQMCATELRRLRKRGRASDPNVTLVINDLVCEGCGDCSKKSNCLSVVPIDTEFGRKRGIDQSTCNKDRSCVDGFCPSFVTISGGTPRRSARIDPVEDQLPEPEFPVLKGAFPILVTGVGGTGVVTICALLGMAAHMEGKSVKVMDMTGLAQKGGAVVSHVQIGPPNTHLMGAQISLNSARVLIGCDAVVAALPDNLSRLSRVDGHVIANDHEAITGRFTRDANVVLPMKSLRQSFEAAVGALRVESFDATDLAIRLVGDAVGANLMLLGYAWQKGLIPISKEALEAAIQLNAVAVELNKAAFRWGRRAAVDLNAVRVSARLRVTEPDHHRLSSNLMETITRRIEFLKAYQNATYAGRFTETVDRVQASEAILGEQRRLTDVVARTLFRLMAYKDEYEVARLYTECGFIHQIRDQFDGPIRISFHMAPPSMSLGGVDRLEPRKRRFGPWMLPVLRVLAKGRILRGTPFDLFGYTSERRQERALIQAYIRVVEDEVLPNLSCVNHEAAVALAGAMQAVRGYGSVKARSIAVALERQAELLRSFHEVTAQSVATPRETGEPSFGTSP